MNKAVLRITSYQGVMLRAVRDNDNELLYRVFTFSRADLMAATAGWDEVQRDKFMRFQFKTKQEQYRNDYPEARFNVIVTNGAVIGNICIAPVDDELRLVDVNILPEHRNRGIGHALVQDLLDEGARLQKNITLHVQQGNPVIHLYERLGFIGAGEQGFYNRMEWRPCSMTTTATRTIQAARMAVS